MVLFSLLPLPTAQLRSGDLYSCGGNGEVRRRRGALGQVWCHLVWIRQSMEGAAQRGSMEVEGATQGAARRRGPAARSGPLWAGSACVGVDGGGPTTVITLEVRSRGGVSWPCSATWRQWRMATDGVGLRAAWGLARGSGLFSPALWRWQGRAPCHAWLRRH